MEMQMRREIAKVLGIDISNVTLSASFIQLGGNSLSAIALSQSCRRNGFPLGVDTILIARDVSKLCQSATLDRASSVKRLRISKHETFHRENTEDSSELKHKSSSSTHLIKSDCSWHTKLHQQKPLASLQAPIPHMQLSFIHGSRRNPGTNIIHYYETYPLDTLPVIKDAWKQALNSEPIFSTTFDLDNGNGLMIQGQSFVFNWSEIIVNTQELFDAEVGELVRSSDVATSFKVVILQSEEHKVPKCTIIWRIHHCLIDGHSCAVVIRKVRRAAARLPIQPGVSFVLLAQNLDLYRTTWKSEGERFWKRQRTEFGSNSGLISLPKTSEDHAELHPRMNSVAISISRGELSSFAQKSGVTEASLYFSAWALVLSQYVGSDSVTYGAILSGRNLPLQGIHETVGSMVNTLPFHVTLNRASSILDYIQMTFSHLAELSTYQWTTPGDGYSLDFSTALSVLLDGQEDSADTEITPLEVPSSQVVTDIPINISIGGDGKALFTHSNQYNRNTVERMAETFRLTLTSIIKPNQTVDLCLKSILISSQFQELLTMGNCHSYSATFPSVSEDLVCLFEKSATRFPTAIAIEKGSNLVTYAQLNHSANLLARYLGSVVKPGSVVCVHADRSINWIIAIYGILKAKAVYCPIDEMMPAELRKSCFATTESRLFLTPSRDQIVDLLDLEGQVVSVEDILQLSDLSSRIKTVTLPPKKLKESPENAYLCFTSGSTGKPKGVMCTHRGLVAFQKDLEVRLFAEPGRKIAQLMSPAFDGSIHEIFSALSYGSTLVLSHSANPFEHLASVDSVVMTPSVAKMLSPEDYPRLKTVYLVGEAVPQAVSDIWSAKKQLYNMYGPTETTCGATIKRLYPGEPVTIGRPNSSTRLYILSEGQTLLPKGVIGEICLAGVQVSRGYVGQPLESALRFLNDPICAKLGEQMYRTGDRGYWNDAREIICLGRNDRQVKLRGFRLDLDDIETQILTAVPSATSASVTIVDDCMVAMLEPRSLDTSVVRALLIKNLQPYAIPRHLTAVDKIPLTAVGKVDYGAVGKLASSVPVSDSELPMNESQKIVALIWRNVLGIQDDVKITGLSRFSDMGGNSIPMLLFSQRLSLAFGRSVPLRIIMDTSNLEELTRAIEAIAPSQTRSNHLVEKFPESTMLSPIEHEWWVKYELGGNSSCFNVSYVCSLTGEVDRTKLECAWNTVLSRHSILRCRYTNKEANMVERDYFLHPPRVRRLRQMDIQKEVNTPFVLNQQHPIRVLISNEQVLVVASHIICDLTTIKILLDEMGLVYHGSTLEPVKKRYEDTTRWSSKLPSTTLKFWSAYLSNLPHPNVDVGNYDHRRTRYTGSSHVSKIPTATFHAMARFVKTHRVSFHQISLSAVSLALTYRSMKQDIILGAPYLNRTSSDDLGTVGLFLEPLPIRIKYPGQHMPPSIKPWSEQNDEVDPFILAVRESSRAALSHEIPWSSLLEHLQVQPDYPNHPLFDIMVTFHEPDDILPLQILHAKPLYTWSDGSKFKLMVEFQALSQSSLLLRLEHDDECFTAAEIEFFRELLVVSLDCLVSGMRYNDIKKRLQTFAEGFPPTSAKFKPTDFFGVQLERL